MDGLFVVGFFGWGIMSVWMISFMNLLACQNVMKYKSLTIMSIGGGGLYRTNK